MADTARLVVLVHGWSVRSTDTYGELAARLEAEARANANLRLDVRQIWLSQYVSFSDPARVEDLARAFEAAVTRELGTLIAAGRRFVCITHSTGGPVAREWWHRYWRKAPQRGACPMSHLIMLAPANLGAALAQLGASRVSRIKAWFEGVQPGTGVLEWLELGSESSWDLALETMTLGDPTEGPHPVFPFVLTGQSIDRSLYDHLNTYTDEPGSDGVVRTASANLNIRYVRLTQAGTSDDVGTLELAERVDAPRTAFTLVGGKAHSGEGKGIMRSVLDDGTRHETVTAILRCLTVDDRDGYLKICDRFDEDNARVRERERVEVITRGLLRDSVYFHDAHAMVIFRFQDDRGHMVEDYDLLLTAGRPASPDLLPKGFLVDRQRNSRRKNVLTFYFNHDVMRGLRASKDRDGTTRRPKLSGTTQLGCDVSPRPADGFVHFRKARLPASMQVLETFLRPDQTTLVDIQLTRVVHEGAFQLTQKRDPHDFTKVKPGRVLRT